MDCYLPYALDCLFSRRDSGPHQDASLDTTKRAKRNLFDFNWRSEEPLELKSDASCVCPTSALALSTKYC
eukprot:scaffold346283_cov17-Prasinocladus_malaysianus.AAC.1